MPFLTMVEQPAPGDCHPALVKVSVSFFYKVQRTTVSAAMRVAFALQRPSCSFTPTVEKGYRSVSKLGDVFSCRRFSTLQSLEERVFSSWPRRHLKGHARPGLCFPPADDFAKTFLFTVLKPTIVPLTQMQCQERRCHDFRLAAISSNY